ncbi:hypothetical protein FA13DRAFT_1777545 [Coprinellus micaceus]|uniref:Amino acid transporter transmembrane domain-containing protein n=1 Tax=Coprinellus micaceus TaxID=71717 RepID=A0A4Y7STN8_COPMI|nr:hypothetical protein FA13DRAFT_1777545 [Coprinellus micaceus]
MSSPSQPISIKGPRLLGLDGNNDNGESTSYVPSVLDGTPNLHAFRSHVGTPPVPNIPLHRSSTPLQRTGSPALGPIPLDGASPRRTTVASPPAIAGSVPSTRYGVLGGGAGFIGATGSPAPLQPPELEGLTDEDKARVLRRHLVMNQDRLGTPKPDRERSIAGSDIEDSNPQEDGPPETRDSVAGTPRIPNREESEPFPIPYHAPGADVTHDIYKWHADQQRAARQRAVSFHALRAPQDPAFEHIHEPGGFRRNYLLLRADEQGDSVPPMTETFIDFLTLFGHFAGEDLEEEEEEKDTDEEEEAGLGELEITEETPLVRQVSVSRQRSRSRRRRGESVGPGGNATVTQAVLMLLKSFIGTGVLFLGKAYATPPFFSRAPPDRFNLRFMNGGLLFSALTFVFIAAISLYSFLLLIDTKFVVSGSFGDIGGALYGPWMRYTILGSIVVSQIGFVAAYTIFVSENLQAFVLGVTNCLKLIPVQYFILMQLVIFLPLALVRDLAKLSSTALVADAFILVGLVYIFGSEIKLVAERGIADVKLFNSRDFPLFIGTAVFSFEGIGLIIPITDAMREPHKFPRALTWVMAFLVVLFGGAGALAYLTFGSDIQTVVLVNLDSRSKMVQSVQFLYALAILLSVPLQLFPAVRILENGLFYESSGKRDPRVKWYKNFFRFGMVILCSLISWAGAADLDKFVAFVGSFACVPLCYVYPAMLHLRAVARTRRQRLADWAMITFGMIAAAYTTTQTIKHPYSKVPFPSLLHIQKLMLEPSAEPGSPYGNCEA